MSGSKRSKDHVCKCENSDTENLEVRATALWIGGAGNVSVEMEKKGSAVVFKAVPVGLLRVAVTRVNAEGTTATNIVALY